MPNLSTTRLLLALIALSLTAGAWCASQTERDRIRGFLEALDAGQPAVVAGRSLNEPETLAAVYRARDHTPIWLDDAPLHAQAESLLVAIDHSLRHGFSAERYHYSVIQALMSGGGRGSGFALDLLLTDAFLSQALHRGRGAVLLRDLDPEWMLPAPEVDAGALLLDTAQNQRSVSEQLEALWPVSSEYAQLLRRRSEIAASGDETATIITPGPFMKPGQSSERVVLLKQRLMGPGDYSALYDGDLRREVMAFQYAAGLEPDGIVGEHTLELLNATRLSWIERLDANLERWRWLPRETPANYVRVNIAAATLRAIENGSDVLSMKVIVGLPYRQTPVFTEKISYLVLNPFWNVPYSIATKDKLPLLKADATAEAQKGYEARTPSGDLFMPVSDFEWKDVTPRTFQYLLRQRPGPYNALGRIKFMLPNPHAVYLHDTPSGELFARQERIFSSGCIRLERPLELATWLLSRENHPQAGNLERLVGSGETQTLYLSDPTPAYIVYFTAFVSEEGAVAFRRDVYGRDKPLIEALKAEHP